MNKRTAKRIRQNNHRLYHESVKREIKFKEAAKAPPIKIQNYQHEPKIKAEVAV